MRFARAAGTRVVLDIDYRPVLWGLTGLGLGEQRFVASDRVSAHLQTVVAECDLIVGTEEEIHIAGGATDTLAALRALRALTPATLVVKRGPMGCVVFPGAIPDALDKGVVGPGFPVEVYNILGAGDAFMAGFLRGWLRDEPLERCAAYANACGALVVSRHGCAPAIPSWEELEHFLAHGSRTTRLREDAGLERLHRVTTRTKRWPSLAVLAFDHRAQLEAIADEHGAPRERIRDFKRLVAEGAVRGAGDTAGRRRDPRRPLRRGRSARPHRAGAVDRETRRGAGLAAARVRSGRQPGARAARLARRARREVPRLLPPRRPAGVAPRAGRQTARAPGRVRCDVPRAARRGAAAARARCGRLDDRPLARAALRGRYPIPTGGSCRRRPTSAPGRR